jgi:hypothetical protein
MAFLNYLEGAGGLRGVADVEPISMTKNSIIFYNYPFNVPMIKNSFLQFKQAVT